VENWRVKTIPFPWGTLVRNIYAKNCTIIKNTVVFFFNYCAVFLINIVESLCIDLYCYLNTMGWLPSNQFTLGKPAFLNRYLVQGSGLFSGVPRNIVRGGVQQIQLRTEDRERRSWGGIPLVRGSGGSCNLVQEISFHIVKFS